MQLNIDIVDAFTSRQFGGNSAAVILLDTWLNDDLMLAIAAQNNLSETAFVVAKDQSTFHIRWFSPLVEIDFCGHATLAAAFVLFSRFKQLDKITVLADAVGELFVKKASDGQIVMDFPARPPIPIESVPTELLAGLSIAPVQVMKSPQAYFAIYNNQSDVEALVTASEQLIRLGPLDVVATAPGLAHDFVSRYFWPANGGDEDPVTGSIHTGLAPYWADKLGKTRLRAYQASARGGELLCECRDDRVIISGKAVFYSSGTITLQNAE